MTTKQRSNWGWGYAGEQPTASVLNRTKGALFPAEPNAELTEPDWKVVASSLRKPRFKIQKNAETERLLEICSSDALDRIRHSYGKAFRDVVRALQGDFDNPPDYVAYPTLETDLLSLLRYCQQGHVAVVPFGGGSSVTGGIEPPGQELVDQMHWPRGVISVDMKFFDKVLDVDPVSLTARVQAGVFGPELLAQLRRHNVTLRHFPQSFEFSTVGGWVATRAGGHYATGRTHIDDFVVSVRMVTPKGVIQTRRLPASGAGPQPERVVAIGSEGIFGIITECTLSVQKPVLYAFPNTASHRVSSVVYFDEFMSGVEAVREIVQSGSLQPSNCRLIDGLEAFANGLSPNMKTTLILGFEASEHPEALQPLLLTCLKIAQRHKGVSSSSSGPSTPEDPAGGGPEQEWKSSFLRAPYLRDALVKLGYITETFETACPWDRFSDLYNAVQRSVVETAPLPDRCIVTCRITHAYPTGVAPYFTVIAAARADEDRVLQWDVIKSAASEVILRYGATATHHHAVGRDHGFFYRREADSLFLSALSAMKRALDPEGIMNPGILLLPQMPGHGKTAVLSKL